MISSIALNYLLEANLYADKSGFEGILNSRVTVYISIRIVSLKGLEFKGARSFHVLASPEIPKSALSMHMFLNTSFAKDAIEKMKVYERTRFDSSNRDLCFHWGDLSSLVNTKRIRRRMRLSSFFPCLKSWSLIYDKLKTALFASEGIFRRYIFVRLLRKKPHNCERACCGEIQDAIPTLIITWLSPSWKSKDVTNVGGLAPLKRDQDEKEASRARPSKFTRTRCALDATNVP